MTFTFSKVYTNETKQNGAWIFFLAIRLIKLWLLFCEPLINNLVNHWLTGLHYWWLTIGQSLCVHVMFSSILLILSPKSLLTYLLIHWLTDPLYFSLMIRPYYCVLSKFSNIFLFEYTKPLLIYHLNHSITGLLDWLLMTRHNLCVLLVFVSSQSFGIAVVPIPRQQSLISRMILFDCASKSSNLFCCSWIIARFFLRLIFESVAREDKFPIFFWINCFLVVQIFYL